MDHNLYSISATVVPEASAHQLMFNSTAVEASQEKYYTIGKGVYTAPGGIINGFPELSGKKLQKIGAEAVIDAGLTNRSTVELLFESFFYPNSPPPTNHHRTSHIYPSRYRAWRLYPRATSPSSRAACPILQSSTSTYVVVIIALIIRSILTPFSTRLTLLIALSPSTRSATHGRSSTILLLQT